MKKTTTKKAALPKATLSKKVAKDEVKKASTPKAGVSKKPARAKKTEAPAKEVKVPVRKKEPVQKIAAVVQPEVKVEAPKPVAVKKVEVARPVPVVEKPKFVEKLKFVEKPKKVGRALSTLAQGVGRRKEAVARVWLKLGSGKLLVNGQVYDSYFCTQTTRLSASLPFRVINKAQNYDVFANVIGGGVCAQADAVKLGFVRALLKLNEEWRSTFRKTGLLTVDSRQKERKKYGQKGARRKFQFVKR